METENKPEVVSVQRFPSAGDPARSPRKESDVMRFLLRLTASVTAMFVVMAWADLAVMTATAQETPKFTIRVLGEVEEPGSFEVNGPVTVVQAVEMAGGLSASAAPHRVRIARRAPDGEQQIIDVDLSKAIQGESNDIPLRADDVVVVPKHFK